MSAPIACSGAMYSGVPITTPVVVSLVAATWRSGSIIFEIPKSSSFTKSLDSSWSSRKMLSGLRSRWTMPLAWAAPTALSTCRMMPIARFGGSGPSLSITFDSGAPDSSSITT